MNKVDKNLFVHAFGKWMPKDSLPLNKALFLERKKWFSRSRKLRAQ